MSQTAPSSIRRWLRTILLPLIAFSGCGKTENAVTEAPNRPSSSTAIPQVEPSIAEPSKVSTPGLAVASDSTREVYECVLNLARTDFKAALELLEKSRVSPGEKSYVLAHVVQELCRFDLNNLPEYLRQIKDLNARSMALGLVCSDWAKSDPSKLVSFALAHLEGADRNRAAYTGLNRLIQSGQRVEVAAFIDQMPFSTERSQIIQMMASSFGSQNPEGAIEWAQKLPLPEDQLLAYKQIVPFLSANNKVTELIDLANSVANLEFKKECVQAAVRSLSQTADAASASKWIASLPVEIRSAAELQLVAMGADRDIPSWTKYVLGTSSPEVRGQGIITLANRAFERGPSYAVEWLGKLPPGAQSTAASVIVSNWYNTDSVALSDWINTLKPGGIRDLALDRLAHSLGTTDYNTAVEVAQKIGDQKRMKSVLGDLSRNHHSR